MKGSGNQLLDRFEPLYQSSRLRGIVAAAMVLLSVGILGTIVARQWEALIEYDWNLRWGPVLASFLVFSVDLFLVALVWASIMDSMGEGVGIRKHIRYYFVTNAAKRLPGRIWHVAGRAFFYKKEGISVVLTSLASALELTILTLSGVLVTLVFGISIVSEYTFGLASLAAVLIMGAVLVHPRVLNQILSRIGTREQVQFSYKNLAIWISAYSIAWMLGGITLFAVGNSVGTIEPEHIPYVIGSWSLVGVLSTALFFLPTNLGLTEVGLTLLLSNIIPAPVAVVVALAARLLITAYEILWAALASRL